MRCLGIILAVVVAGVVLSSCSVTRRFPEGSYMLKRNVIEVDKQVPRKMRISSGELNRYVQQTPNRHFLGTNLYAWLYAQADPEKHNKGNNFLRRAGEPPVVWSLEKTQRSAENLKTYIESRGFFGGSAEWEVDTLRRKKVRVRYSVHQGEPSYLGEIKYLFADAPLEPLVMTDSAATLLHEGDIFDINVMDQERRRITQNLKNKGYYDFDVGNITYVADSLNSTHLVNLTMVVHRQLAGYGEDGTARYENHKPYKLDRIFVQPDYNPLGGENASLDTMPTRGINLIYGGGKVNVRPRVLARAMRLKQGALYSADGVTGTYGELMRLGAFRSVSVLFDPVKGRGDTLGYGLLNCDIRGIPGLKQSFGVEFEASTTSSFYGLRATLSYQNRNIFRGAELFDASLTGGFEFLKSSKRKLSYELGMSLSLTFPRIVFWEVDRRNRLKAPQSKLTLSANWQDRVYYSRALFGLTWGYSWGIRRFENFTLRPFDVSLVRVLSMDDVFRRQLNNPYLVASYADQLIAGISASYVYNNQPRDLGAGAVVLRVNVETTGNLFSGLTRLFGKQVGDAGDRHYNVLGIRFSQYVRGDVSFSQKIVLGEKTSLAYRINVGAILSYGNSTSPPFDKLFYAGGVNSMRGWAVRTLGPGSQLYVRQNYPAQMGDVKLEANLEFRFPIFSPVNGAVFADVGNIWFMRSKPDEYSDAAVFRFKNFYKQLGFNTGAGVRVDLKFVVLRLDWGIQLHSPNRPAGERWIYDFKWKNMALNFGVGYPF